MSVNAFVNFKGNCREAVAFYANVFELPAPVISTFGEYHAEMNEEEKNYVMYTQLEIAGSMVQFSDSPSVMSLNIGNNVSLSVQTNDQDLLKKWYPALSEGGVIHMPLQETVWSKCYASFVDKFGVCWQFNQY